MSAKDDKFTTMLLLLHKSTINQLQQVAVDNNTNVDTIVERLLGHETQCQVQLANIRELLKNMPVIRFDMYADPTAQQEALNAWVAKLRAVTRITETPSSLKPKEKTS